jgi:capsular polysaccharide biosynthesis protein
MYAGDGLEFLEYLWRSRAIVGAACATALVFAGGVSAVLPLRYTATASVLIDSPGGNDPRAATAVSPVYLESLKTYELLASSDTIFSRALDDLQLRGKYPNASIESLKRRILALNKPTNTTILEISATLDDPRQAQALAQYIAEHTVKLNAQLDNQANQDILQEPQRIFDQAISRRTRAEKAREEFGRTTSVETTAKEVAAAEDLRKEVQLDLARAKAELAEDVARQQAPPTAAPQDSQAAWTRIEIVAERARVQELEAQDKQLLDLLSQKELGLEALGHTRDSLDAELKSARAGEEAAQTKLGDVQSSAAFRGVRLKVLDPGIVPQRASFPNTPLNLAVAFVFSLAASIAFVAIRFGYQRLQRAHADPVYSLR